MKPSAASLTVSQLAIVDAVITRAQERGLKFNQSISHTEETVTLTDAHHPLFDFSERDRRTLEQIRQLASQLEFSVSLGDLIEMRGKAVQDLARR